MARITRDVVKIDEEKCDGCGLCIPSCKEGAIQLIDGKARLVGDVYCDGLGACLGECPRGAITIEKREADAFDEAEVEKHLAKNKTPDPLPCGCPGTMAKSIGKKQDTTPPNTSGIKSELQNWPIQLKLIPPTAPYLAGADIVLLADCSAVAYANLHRDFIRNRIVIMACPKLDDQEFYIDKLAQIFETNDIRSIEVVMMEVPCCAGLGEIVDAALVESGSGTKKFETVINLEGKKLQSS